MFRKHPTAGKCLALLPCLYEGAVRILRGYVCQSHLHLPGGPWVRNTARFLQDFKKFISHLLRANYFPDTIPSRLDHS